VTVRTSSKKHQYGLVIWSESLVHGPHLELVEIALDEVLDGVARASLEVPGDHVGDIGPRPVSTLDHFDMVPEFIAAGESDWNGQAVTTRV
jgi:hypothetical protein